MNASNRFLVKRWTAIGLLAAILLLLPNFASAAPVTINFGTDGAGNPVIAGQVLDDEWNTPAYGNMVISSPTNATHPIVAFNSSIPTGGDPDLGSPNQTCPGGGPGVGVGGVVGAPFENCTSLGMLVIIEENCPLSTAVGGIITYPSCGAPGPDDNGGANGPAGGIINFTFGTTVDDQVTIESFELLDFEDPAGAGEAVLRMPLGGREETRWQAAARRAFGNDCRWRVGTLADSRQAGRKPHHSGAALRRSRDAAKEAAAGVGHRRFRDLGEAGSAGST